MEYIIYFYPVWNEAVLYRVMGDKTILLTENGMSINLIGCILRINCIEKHIFVGKFQLGKGDIIYLGKYWMTAKK